ncbi:MAG: anti-sigma factor [Microthrixaceae bacterium]|nr:anti-sigma factor [Microthrixaceae bacterium]
MSDHTPLEPTHHDELRELLGAYALDAVEPGEAAAVERHLRACPQCRAEVEEHRAVAALLGNAGAAAPAGLWDRIAEAIDGDEGGAPVPSDPVAVLATLDGHDGAGPRPAPDAPAPVIPLGDARRGRRWSRPTVAVAAVAAACLLVAGAVGVLTIRDQQARIDDLAAQVDEAGVPGSVADALADPGSRVVRLAPPGSGDRPGDDGLVLRAVVTADGDGYLLGGTLPDAGPGSTYQLWGLDGGRAVSLGVLGHDPGVEAFQVEAPTAALAITTEARGGADQPTSAPLVVGSLA